MRVFIPATPTDLAVANSGAWAPPYAFAASPELAVAVDDEDVAIEFARDAAAAESVLGLGAPRRLVIAADIPDPLVAPAPDRHPAAVKLSGPIPAGAVACAFVDEPEAVDDAAAARDGDAEALERLEWRDLLWYDVSEFPDLT